MQFFSSLLYELNGTLTSKHTMYISVMYAAEESKLILKLI